MEMCDLLKTALAQFVKSEVLKGGCLDYYFPAASEIWRRRRLIRIDLQEAEFLLFKADKNMARIQSTLMKVVAPLSQFRIMLSNLS